MYFVYSAFTSRPTPLLVANKASVLFFTVCVVKDSGLLGCDAASLPHPAMCCHIPQDWSPQLRQSGNLKPHVYFCRIN
jgi:hypothetical protein